MGALFRAAAAAVLTGLLPGDGNALLAAEDGFLKGQLQAHPQVFALPGAGTGPLASGAAEAAAEHGAENIAQIKVLEAAEAASRATGSAGAAGIIGIDARIAKLVVAGLFFRIGKDLVGAVDLFHFCLGGLVAGVQVGMIFFGQPAVGLFDLILRGALLELQNLI